MLIGPKVRKGDMMNFWEFMKENWEFFAIGVGTVYAIFVVASTAIICYYLVGLI